MPAKQNAYRADLEPLIEAAVQHGDAQPLELYLTERARLSPTYTNLPMAHAFADLIGEIAVREPRTETLLDTWAALTPNAIPPNDRREILPMAAILAYGQVAVVCRDRWEAVVNKLHTAASDPGWRIREMVAAAFQRMLTADWDRAYKVLYSWLSDHEPLVIRAAAAAVAEPPILTDAHRGENALEIQVGAVERFATFPANRRREESVRVLRQALGFTLSVAIAAVPDSGFAFLQKLAGSPDKDIQWIVKENLKKKRLHAWPDRVEKVQQ